jgi:DNA-binding PadR family transcriptional regulator
VPSTLGFAILGLLAREPHTGYDLARRMRRPVGYFWQSTHSQIYPELHRLEADGLVRYDVVDGRGPRDTKRYEITEAGLGVLRDWLAQPSTDAPARDEFALRVFSLWLVDPAVARELVRAQRDQHSARLADYREQERQMRADVGAAADPQAPDRSTDPALFASYATLRGGIGYESHRVAWCDWLLEQLADTGAARRTVGRGSQESHRKPPGRAQPARGQ